MDVGVQIGQYEIVEHIGRGGMADVWSARDTSLGRMVAIKSISPDLTSDKNDPAAMFEHEARTIANLEHPHILPIYGFGQFQGKFYIVMRYVTGGSLDSLLVDNAVSYDYALKIGRSLAEALHHAHTESVVHLDLKPPNILLDSKRVPYLADFGLAIALGADGRAKNPGAGTLLYMAPEQMTSDEIDHRADVYSYGLVMYHILTGALPFSGRTSLALRQLQTRDQLPHLSEINPDLPDALTDVLRRCTAMKPDDRYDSVMTCIDEIENVLHVSGSPTVSGGVSNAVTTPFTDLISSFDPADVQRNEAEDIYRRAHQAWANGNGRFLLSITHFMVMSEFYEQADDHNLSVDHAGLQLLLRGALEHDYHLAYWWQRQPNNDNRRWVCLHTIRSENAQARIRAYNRLTNLPDADPPIIPLQVAQALVLENNEQAALAALDVLAERARFIPQRTTLRSNSSIKKSTFVETIVRDQLQIVSATEWLPYAYSEEIDGRVADMALNGMTADVRAQAARTAGRLRSVTAVQDILEAHQGGESGTVRALAYVLDEAPSLPPSVPFGFRLEAWLRNTVRRLSENPMQIVWAFFSAMLIGWVAMGQHIYRIFRAQAIFNQQRVLNTFAIGLLFGFFLAVLTVMAKTLPTRLRGFWPNWTRFIWSALSGYYLSQLIWWAYVWALLNLDSPPKEILVITGVGTALGFVLPTMIKMRGWVAVLLTTLTTFTVHYIGFQNFWSSYYGTGEQFSLSVFGVTLYTLQSSESWIFAYDQQVQIWTIMLPMILLMALGVHLPDILADLRHRNRRDDTELATLEALDPVTSVPPQPGPAVQPVTQRRQAQELQPLVEDDGARTEEFNMSRVGGRAASGQPDPRDDSTALQDPNLKTVIGEGFPLPGERTEEFDVDKVGGSGSQGWDDDTKLDAGDTQAPAPVDDTNTTVGPVTDWDDIARQLDDLQDDDEYDEDTPQDER